MSTESSDATQRSCERMIAVRPRLARCVPLGNFRALPARTLLHAGPPFASREQIPRPVLNAAVAAALFEGWAPDAGMAADAIRNGAIVLAPAQDHGVVTPLAFVVSPSMYGLVVEDEAAGAAAKFAPLNDGPPPAALRFGAATPGRDERLALLARIGPALSRAFADPIDMLPVMRAGIAGGDDLHGRVSAANAALSAYLLPRLDGEARAYLETANQFVLNALMAACALMIGAGEGIADSRMVTAAGANGVDIGWRIGGEPTLWRTLPATLPAGPRFGSAVEALPAIGDSAVIDACGFGAAALRYAPELGETLRSFVPDVFFDARASEPFLGPHPAFPADLRFGLAAGRPSLPLGVLLAAIDAGGEQGLIGRGVAPWSC